MKRGTGRTIEPVLTVRSLRVELDFVEGTVKRREAAASRAPREPVAKRNGSKPRGHVRAAA